MLREKKPIRSYHGEQFRTNPTNKKHLAEDFGHRCAYCDDLDTYGGGYRAYHVEHFAPKEKFPALRFDYDNLLYACPWCNRAKWDIWPSNDPKINVVGKEGFIDPCSEEYDQHLERLADGSIAGMSPLGKYMLLSATPRISAIKSTMFAKISPKLKSMYLTMICLLEDSRVRTILS